jgi:hypothetical protein
MVCGEKTSRRGDLAASPGGSASVGGLPRSVGQGWRGLSRDPGPVAGALGQYAGHLSNKPSRRPQGSAGHRLPGAGDPLAG